MKYKVTADNLVGFDKGDTIEAGDLKPGTNLDALVASGHLKAAPAPKSTESKGK